MPRILVIDDASDYLDFMRMLLTGEGYEVTVAASLAAVRTAATTPPDLVICDIALPGEEPFAALDLLDREPAFAGVPVIVVSGAVHLFRDDRRWQDGRRRALLEKPFDIETLLPLIDELLGVGEPTPAVSAAAPVAPPVLVVDDDAATRELVRLTLADEGYRVVTAADGRQALASVAAEPPALVLLDLTIPALDGWGVHALLRAEHPSLPVVYMTAATRARTEAARHGAAGWLAKPFGQREVLATVAQFMSGIGDQGSGIGEIAAPIPDP